MLLKGFYLQVIHKCKYTRAAELILGGSIHKLYKNT